MNDYKRRLLNQKTALSLLPEEPLEAQQDQSILTKRSSAISIKVSVNNLYEEDEPSPKEKAQAPIFMRYQTTKGPRLGLFKGRGLIQDNYVSYKKLSSSTTNSINTNASQSSVSKSENSNSNTMSISNIERENKNSNFKRKKTTLT